MTGEGYPTVLLYAVLLAGVPLALLRPYAAFIACAFAFAARNSRAATFTRTALLGPYFNLDDALLLVCLVSVLARARARGKLRVPRLAGAILGVWATGAVVGMWGSGLSYEVLREIRWALTFPLCFLIGANAVHEERDAGPLLAALFAGSVLAAAQHVVYVRTGWGYALGAWAQVRTIAYWAPGLYFLVAHLVKPFVERVRSPRWAGYQAALGLFAVSLVLNQTRSLWIACALAVPVIGLLAGQWARIPRTVARAVVVVALALAIATWVVPALDLGQVVHARAETLIDRQLRAQSTATRQAALRVELRYWVEGNWLVGRGLGYQWGLADGLARDESIAFGHLGYVSYLARLGLIGLAVYGLYLPLSVARMGGQALRRLRDGPARQLALLALAFVVVDTTMFAMSGSYLSQAFPNAAIVYGALWSMGHGRAVPDVPRGHAGAAV